jgi:hypothetical protein
MKAYLSRNAIPFSQPKAQIREELQSKSEIPIQSNYARIF